MALDLRANTAVDVLIGPFVDSTDGNTTEDGLTLAQADIKLSKLGQALTQKNDNTTAAFDDDGYYNCELDGTDTNTEGQLVLIVHEAGALPVRHEFNVMAEAAWDSHYAAKDDGFMDVNIKTVGRTDTQETEANNLESACSNYSVTRGLTGTALPAAAADAAGGVPVSDAGGLDMDAMAISDILNVQPLIPVAIDLANTASVRIGLGLANMLDDLPSTAEITPGTITIDHKAVGGTTWFNLVTAAACSEAAGLIYYDEVFDTGTGYAAGDAIRIIFQSQKIVVGGNDYEIVGATGWTFHTYIRTAMRGTDNAALASVVGALNDAAAAGDPSTNDTVVQYVKQLINVLVGTAGVGTFPAEAAPANAVSLAEVLRAIHVDVTGLNGAAMVGTNSAALASVCTEARLAELAAANLPTDVAGVKSDTAAILLDTGTDGVVLASGEDVYHADVFFAQDEGNSQDEYTVVWYKNGAPVTTGITSPTLWVFDRGGNDLVATSGSPQALAQISTTGCYSYDEGTNRLTDGEAAIAEVKATIDAATRTWRRPVGRDATS